LQRTNKKKSTGKLILVKTLIAIAGLLISSALFIIYSHRYNYIYQYGPATGIVLSGIGLITLWDSDKPVVSKWHRVLFGIVFGLILFSFLIALITLRTMYTNYQLHKYGAKARGIVIDIETHTSPRTRTSYHAIVKYNFDKKTYWQDILDNQHLYKYGDSLLLKCSSHDPEIIVVVSHTSALKTEY
jgi:hypothetical protein